MADDELVQITLKLKDARKFMADTQGAGRAVGGLGDTAENTSKRSRAAAVGVNMFAGGVRALGVAVVASSVALLSFATLGIGASVHAYAEAEVVGAKVNAVIAATGGVAKVTRDDVDALSTALSMKTGIDDEQISSAQALLLTFKGVRNEVGTTGDIFDRATTAALDMSSATGRDLLGSVTAIGKAMQDPAKGAAALAKGGSLAKTELAELQKMADAGLPIWKQQEYILGALEGQYKGTAAAAGATLGGSLNRLKVVAGNVAETVGAVFAPTIQRIADTATNAAMTFDRARASGASFGFAIATALDGAAGGGSRFREAFVKIREVAGVVFDKLGQGVGFIRSKVIPAVVAFGADIIAGVKPVMPFIENIIIPLFKGLAIGIIGSLVGAWKVVWPVLKLLFAALGWIGKAAAPFKGVIEGIGKVVGFVFGGPILKGIGLLGKFGGVLGVIGRVAGRIGGILVGFGKAVGAVAGFVFRTWFKVMAWWFGTLHGIGKLVVTAMGAVRGAFTSGMGKVLGFLTSLGARFLKAGKSFGGHLVDGIKTAFGAGAGFVAGIASKFGNYVIRLLNEAIPNKLGPINLPNSPIPALANGGVLMSGGTVLVGDGGNGSGAELVDLPRAARVRPLTADERRIAPAESTGTHGGGGRALRVEVPVMLDGREIARGVADVTADDLARK